MRKSVRSSKILVGLALASLVVAGGGVTLRLAPRSPVVEGLSVGDRRVPERPQAVIEWLWARREALRSRAVRFRSTETIYESTLGAAGVTLDVPATLALAEKIGHEGSWLRRFRDARRARRGEIEVPLVWKVDEAKARELLATFAPDLYQAPVDARIDLDKHARWPDEPGRELDVQASVAELVRGTHDDDEIVSLLTRRVLAKVTNEQLTQVNIEKVVSAYETTFSLWGNGRNRAINIKTAASRLDGKVLGPGQILSFNEVVGPRTRERGFALAPEIQGDELQLGYGGGTCQASSTLHAAALFGALEIVDRQSHSRPSSYTQMGLDATVSYPLADLKIRNTLPYPIMIHAFSPKPTSIRVELLGGDPVARVEYAYGVGQTEGFLRRVQVRQGLEPGRRVLHQKGIRGFDVTSVVKIHYVDGRNDQRTYFSGYRPAPEIYWIAPGYDVTQLPPLSEHAKGVEGVVGG